MALRFDRVHAPARRHFLREVDRVAANEGADVEHNATSPKQRRENLEFGFAPFAVAIERPADELVVAIEHEPAMPATLQRHMTVCKQLIAGALAVVRAGRMQWSLHGVPDSGVVRR